MGDDDGSCYCCPTGTGAILGASFALISPAIGVLLPAPPGWTARNIGAFSCFVAGGALSGFALSRLLVGLLIVHRSGNWDASGRDWIIGAVVVVLGTGASAGHSAATMLHTAPGIY